MIKKIIMGVLALTIVGAAAAGFIFNKNNPQEQAVSPEIVLDQAAVEDTAIAESNPETPQEAVVQNEPMAAEMLGEPFELNGQITALDTTGMDLLLESGESIYVELGPQEYWQSLGIPLNVEDMVRVAGNVADDMYHATTVSTADAQTLVLRSDTGAPMWSGGIDNAAGANGTADGAHTPDPQAQVLPEDWVMLEGTLASMTNGTMTIDTADGIRVTFQSGQPRFFQSQGVTFTSGDAVSVYGYYNGDQFVAGDVTQVNTGLRVFLRDPNGRPLWAGPGGNGNGNGNGGNNANAPTATSANN